MHTFIICLLLLPFVAASSYDIQQLFGPHLSSDAEIILRPASNWFEVVQQRWSTWAAPSYKGAIKVASAEDVQNIVSRVKRHGIICSEN